VNARYARLFGWAVVTFLIFLALAGCKTPAQIRAVQTLDDHSERIHIACLDVNGDGRIDAADASPSKLADITGDGKVDESDLKVVRAVDLAVSERPADCGSLKGTDWQITPPGQVDCAAGKGGYIVYGVGGGAVDLNNDTNAAGVRWMLVEIGKLFDSLKLPHQLISLAPGLVGTANPQPDAETWAATYLSEQLAARPCLRLIMIGHSHGAVNVTAVASRLEQKGLANQIVLSALIDRVTYLYGGDTASIPQSSPVFNIFLANGEINVGKTIDQPNVENWNATGQLAPQHGEKGGPLKPATHTTIDNARAVLDAIVARILASPNFKASG
jgi:hypothetical protein